MFSDSLEDNLAIITDIVSGMPDSAQARMRRAAGTLEKTIVDIIADSPKDPAVALGILWATTVIAKRMAEGEHKDVNLIQLVS